MTWSHLQEPNMKLTKTLFILFLLLSISFSLLARDALPPLIEKGEPFNPKTYKQNFYIDKQSPVNSVAISKDGKTIVSGSNDNSVKIWDRATGKLLKTLEGHTDDVTSVAISKDGKTIVSGSYDNSVKIWDRATGKLLKTLEGHTSIVTSVAISKDGKTIVSGSYDKSIKIWDRATGKLLKTLEGHTSTVFSVSISQDAKYIVSGSYDKTVKIWARESGKLLKTLDENASVVSLSISKNAKYIVTGLSDNSIKIWARESGKLLKTLEGHTSIVYSVSISQDAKYIVSGSNDKTVKIWARESGKLLKTLEGHTGSVRSVIISKDTKYIVSGSYDKSIKIWLRESGKLFKTLKGYSNNVLSLAISQDAKYIVSCSNDKSVKIWKRESGKLIKVLEGHIDRVRSVAISQDAKYIVSGSYDKTVKIWDRVTGKILKTLKGHTSTVFSVSISQDAKYIVSGSYDKTVKIWERKSGKLLKTLKADTNLILISEDSQYILSSSLVRHAVSIWERESGKYLITLYSRIDSDVINSIAISNDNKYIVTGLSDGRIKIWGRESGKLLKTLEGHTKYVTSVTISQDAKTIVSIAGDGSIKTWEIKSGKLLKTLEGHTDSVSSVAISKDGKTIVSGSGDGSVKIWDINKKSALKTLIAGQRGTWLSLDHEKSLFYRGDDGTLLYRRNGSSLSLAMPKWLAKEDNITLKSSGVRVVNNSHKSLKIAVKNISNNRLYWVKNSYYADEYCHLLEYRTSTIKSNEVKNLSIDVDVTLPRLNPKPMDNHEINLTMLTATGSEFNITVPVSIRYANMVVKKAEVSEDKKTLNLTLQNIGNEPLLKAEVQLSKPFRADKQEISNIEANKTKELSFVIPEKLDENATVALKIMTLNKKGQKALPVYEWHRDNVTIDLHTLAWYVYALWALGVLVLLGLVWYFRRYKNPLVVKLSKEPNSLKRLNATQLKEAKSRLEKINRLEETLALADVSKKDFDNALAFFEGSPEEKAKIFSQKIKRSKLSKDSEFFKLNCTKSDLSVDDFLLYFTEQKAQEIEEKLSDRGDRIFVVGSSEEQESIVALGDEKTNNIIACSEQDLSEFLLSSKAENLFMKILSECLEFSSISLYQTSGGLHKENDFFGRIKIVRDIKMNSKHNYMIVGGRQLGKSSILRKLHRSYATSSTVDCRFINLEGKKGELITALAENFELPKGAGLEEVLAYVRQSKKKMLLLIDEVDEFVEPEQANGYERLKALKNLAEEGKANFVLAGYWTLYQYITADYQSPLYNFGELIVLEGLEKKACRELMTEPMKRIGVKYEDEASLDEVIELCGQRANLIATVCDEVLNVLETKTISAKALKNALQSNAVNAKLEGWSNIDSSEKRNSRIDRMVIYLSISKETFELDEVLSLFEELDVKVDASEIKKSLERLVIAYVLQKEGAVFSHRIPLMKADILKTNEKGRKALLAEEVTKFSK